MKQLLGILTQMCLPISDKGIINTTNAKVELGPILNFFVYKTAESHIVLHRDWVTTSTDLQKFIDHDATFEMLSSVKMKPGSLILGLPFLICQFNFKADKIYLK